MDNFLLGTLIGVTMEEQSGRQTGKRNRVTDIRRGADIVTRKKRQHQADSQKRAL
jgi:hypothetical protein